MKKKILTSLVILFGLAIMFYLITVKDKNNELVTINANSLLEELTIDNLIDRAELIIIGEVKTTLPSYWMYENEKGAQRATPKELFDAEGLFTDSIFLVNETLKGSLEGSTVRVRTFIGETEQVRWSNSMEPEYQDGYTYLLFLVKDRGPTQIVDPGDYISVNAIDGVYEIISARAVSVDDNWLLNDLVDYIHESPLSKPTGDIPDTPEAKQIIQIIETAYDIEAEVAYTFKNDRLPSIFINDSRFQVNSEKLEFVKNVIDNPVLEFAGYLDYKNAYYNWWKEGLSHYESLNKKAKAENRAITNEELNAFLATKWGSIPGRVKSPVRYNRLKFISLSINNEIAKVVLNDGPTVRRLTLVLVNGQWYIAACENDINTSVRDSC
jgi:hypothetical protein